jgi:hypothetical protein
VCHHGHGQVGEVLWEDKKITARNTGRIADGFVAPDRITTGWSPYTSFLAVRADEGHLGKLLTYTSTSWGGRNATQRLANPYRLKQRLQFPIVSLTTRERGDANSNIDPAFKIVNWSSRENFPELAPPTAPQAAAIPFVPRTDVKPRIAEIINDDIPF